MKKKLTMFYLFLSTFFLIMQAQADNIGQVSVNILGPAKGVAHAINAACYIMGVGFLLAALLQYKYHRENPQQVRISTPIFLVLMGLFILAVPFVAMHSSGGAFLK